MPRKCSRVTRRASPTGVTDTLWSYIHVCIVDGVAPLTATDTRHRLVDAAIESLVDVGFAATTGVEVCRRAGLTRGALNHHFPDFTDLLADALEAVYTSLLPTDRSRPAAVSLESWVRLAHRSLSRPQFKAVIELWLASQNSPAIGAAMAAHIESLAWLFHPDAVLPPASESGDGKLRRALYRTVAEALIGLALGRASQGGKPLSHEQVVVDFLAQLAGAFDRGDLGPILDVGEE